MYRFTEDESLSPLPDSKNTDRPSNQIMTGIQLSKT
jgi:hypothetical protein